MYNHSDARIPKLAQTNSGKQEAIGRRLPHTGVGEQVAATTRKYSPLMDHLRHCYKLGEKGLPLGTALCHVDLLGMHFIHSSLIPVVLSFIASIGSCTASRAFGCSQQIIDHLRLAFDDVQTTLRTVLSIEETLDHAGVIGPFGGTQPQQLRQTYFGDADEEEYDHIKATLSNMPEAIGAASFSCIDAKHDPWGQRDKCDTHVALSQHERNHIVLCPAFLRTSLLGNTSTIGATVEQVHGEQEHLAAHVLIHELAHTSAASGSRRIVDWFLMAPLGGEKGKFAYQSSPVQELACMSPRHAVENADNVAWYAMSMALAVKGAVVDRISRWDCRQARRRYEALIDPENFMIST